MKESQKLAFPVAPAKESKKKKQKDRQV